MWTTPSLPLLVLRTIGSPIGRRAGRPTHCCRGLGMIGLVTARPTARGRRSRTPASPLPKGL